ADDPLTAWPAMAAHSVVWVAAGQPWTEDASGCPACGSRIDFSGSGWRCTGCGIARPPIDVDVTPTAIVMDHGTRLELGLQLPGRATRSNAAMAVAAARRLGIEPASALAAISALTAVDARYRSTTVDGIPVRLLLAKNPAGWLEILDIISDSTGP